MTIHNDSQDGAPRGPGLKPRETGKKLQIGIVGAGIGGLMAAVALLESGHDVEIFERSRFKSEVGAAICAPPNSSRILAHYGFDLKRSRATLTNSLILYRDPANINEKTVIPYSGLGARYGAPWYFFHRVDLHTELKRMATEPTAARAATARLHLATPASRVDEDGTIRFEDGSSVQKDVVIAADGIRSSFLSTVVQDAEPPKHHMSILRYLVPTDQLLADPELTSFFDSGLTSIRAVDSVDKRAVIYGCRGGSLQNVGLIYAPDLSLDADGNDVSASENFEKKVVAMFPKTIQHVCAQAEGVGQWKLFTRTPLKRFARGRVVVMGDAAHPMPPLRAQGGAMAIEDAAALGVLLSDVGSEGEVAARLDMFNELRLKRVAATQVLSADHEWDPASLTEEQVGYFQGRVPQTEADIEDYSFEYDVMREAAKLLSERRKLP